MTPNVYLVWCRKEDSKIERTVGFAYTWKRAERMAKDLFSIKKNIDKCENIITGISLLECGHLYTTTLPKMKWQILPIMTVLTSAWQVDGPA